MKMVAKEIIGQAMRKSFNSVLTSNNRSINISLQDSLELDQGSTKEGTYTYALEGISTIATSQSYWDEIFVKLGAQLFFM